MSSNQGTAENVSAGRSRGTDGLKSVTNVNAREQFSLRDLGNGLKVSHAVMERPPLPWSYLHEPLKFPRRIAKELLAHSWKGLKGTELMTERASSGQIGNINGSNTLHKVVSVYNPKYKMNFHMSTVIEINNGIDK